MLRCSKSKRKIPASIFSEKLVLEKGKAATTPFSKGVLLVFDIINALQKSENKKEVISDLLSLFITKVDAGLKLVCIQNTIHLLIDKWPPFLLAILSVVPSVRFSVSSSFSVSEQKSLFTRTFHSHCASSPSWTRTRDPLINSQML